MPQRIIDRHAGLVLSLPALLLLSVFVVFPFLCAIRDSLTNLTITSVINPEQKQFIGLQNYYELFTGESSFISALKNTVYFVIIVVPLQTVTALICAVVVNGAQIWQRILRTCFFLPAIVSMAVLSVVWQLLYNPSHGVFNGLLGLLNVSSQPFLDSPKQAMNCLIVMSVWQGAGFQMMLFLGGMQTIPEELYEAARIERANAWQRFRYVTLPMLKNITVFVTFITMVFAFKLFVQPHIITHGGPEGSTETLILLLYDEAFTNGRYGVASAISVLFFAIVVIVTLLQRWLTPKEQRR